MPLGADVYRVCNLLAVASTGRRKRKYRESFTEKDALKLILVSIHNGFSLSFSCLETVLHNSSIENDIDELI